MFELLTAVQFVPSRARLSLNHGGFPRVLGISEVPSLLGIALQGLKAPCPLAEFFFCDFLGFVPTLSGLGGGRDIPCTPSAPIASPEACISGISVMGSISLLSACDLHLRAITSYTTLQAERSLVAAGLLSVAALYSVRFRASQRNELNRFFGSSFGNCSWDHLKRSFNWSLETIILFDPEYSSEIWTLRCPSYRLP